MINNFLKAIEKFFGLNNDNENTARIIAFIDVLGFKDILKSTSDIGNVVELLNNIRKRNSKSKVRINGSMVSIDPDFASFSDHMIISYSLGDDKNLQLQVFHTLIPNLCVSIRELQVKALLQGYLLRGAIAIGDIYYDRDANIIFGQNLNEAIEDESRLAIYPRVIASKSLLDFTRNKGLNFPFEYDSDGICYIDYVKNISGQDIIKCKNVIENAVNNKDEVVKDLRKLTKWVWLMKRFNDSHEKNVGKITYSP